ncbi:MAG TPA: hypothetical protein DCS05_09305 [Nitrospiraceae bacterium]|nr:hypothetical protein [Nitrospiraceae bacterium]
MGNVTRRDHRRTGRTDFKGGAPTSLNEVNNGYISLSGEDHVFLQYDPLTGDPTGASDWKLYFRLVASATPDTEAATTIATSQGRLKEGEVVEIFLDGESNWNFFWFQTTSAGVAQAGGTNDRILEYDED